MAAKPLSGHAARMEQACRLDTSVKGLVIVTESLEVGPIPRQIRRYVAALEVAEIVAVERAHQTETGEHPGMRRANVYTIRFDRVLRFGDVVAHDFMVADQRPSTKNVLKDDRKVDRKDVPSTCSSTVPETVPITATSSPLRGAPHDDDADDSSGKGKDSRRKVAGAKPSAKSSRASAKGNRASAAAQHPAVSEDDIQELIQRWKDRWRLDIHPTRSYPAVIDSICNKLPEIWPGDDYLGLIDQALRWWMYGNSSARSPRVAGTRNPAGYVRDLLSAVCEEYVAAAKDIATELGVDPAGFNLVQTLLDEEQSRLDEEIAAKLAAEEEAKAKEAAEEASIDDLWAQLRDVARELAPVKHEWGYAARLSTRPTKPMTSSSTCRRKSRSSPGTRRSRSGSSKC